MGVREETREKKERKQGKSLLVDESGVNVTIQSEGGRRVSQSFHCSQRCDLGFDFRTIETRFFCICVIYASVHWINP